MQGNILGIYPTQSGVEEKCSKENISIFLNKDKRKWHIGVKANGTDICDQYKVMMSTAIPDMTGGDKIMTQAMKATVIEELQSKNKADHLQPKAPAAENLLRYLLI